MEIFQDLYNYCKKVEKTIAFHEKDLNDDLRDLEKRREEFDRAYEAAKKDFVQDKDFNGLIKGGKWILGDVNGWNSTYDEPLKLRCEFYDGKPNRFAYQYTANGNQYCFVRDGMPYKARVFETDKTHILKTNAMIGGFSFLQSARGRFYKGFIDISGKYSGIGMLTYDDKIYIGEFHDCKSNGIGMIIRGATITALGKFCEGEYAGKMYSKRCGEIYLGPELLSSPFKDKLIANEKFTDVEIVTVK